jgi:PPOX class probable F420-dependent enzyme
MSEFMGHGVKQRSVVTMTPEEVREFIQGRHSMTMCTLGPAGDIHAVAMWYGFLEGDLALESKAKAQKVLNLRRDPRLTCLIEDGEYYEELRGVSIVGTAEIVEDPDRIWELGITVVDRYVAPYTEEMRPVVEAMIRKRVVIKLHPAKFVSWDHRKLGLAPTRPSS